MANIFVDGRNMFRA